VRLAEVSLCKHYVDMTRSHQLIVVGSIVAVVITLLFLFFQVNRVTAPQSIRDINKSPTELLIPLVSQSESIAISAPIEMPGIIDPSELSSCTEDTKLCPGGAMVVRSGESCTFTACPPVREIPIQINCESGQRAVNTCTDTYAPVCGLIAVSCATESCQLSSQDYRNNCFACQDELVVSYSEGMCEFDLEVS